MLADMFLYFEAWLESIAIDSIEFSYESIYLFDATAKNNETETWVLYDLDEYLFAVCQVIDFAAELLALSPGRDIFACDAV